MAALALPFAPDRFSPDLFSVVTLRGGGRRPAWSELFDWKDAGDADIDHALSRTLWAARLDEAVTRADKAVLLVAEGASCFAAAWWARLTPAHYVEKVAGALMFLPGGAGEVAGRQRDWDSPKLHLPFPSIVVADDADCASVRALGADWGSERIAGSARTAEAEAPHWRQALRAVDRFTSRMVARDIVMARHQRR